MILAEKGLHLMIHDALGVHAFRVVGWKELANGDYAPVGLRAASMHNSVRQWCPYIDTHTVSTIPEPSGVEARSGYFFSEYGLSALSRSINRYLDEQGFTRIPRFLLNQGVI